MSLGSLISRKIQNDTAVYWASPVPDGNGTYTLDDPVEIKCFWVNKTQIVMNKDKKETTSRAVVYVDQDLDENGYLYHGEIDDFGAQSTITHPKTINGAYQILTVDKVPGINHPGQYMRRVFLTNKATG